MRKEYFADIRPADTIMAVTRFVNPEWLIEIEVDAVICEAAEGKNRVATLRLTLKSGPTLNLHAKEEVCQNLLQSLIDRYQQEALDLLANDPTSPLYRQR